MGTDAQIFEVPHLATITIEGRRVTVVLDPSLDGTADDVTPDLDDFLKNWKPGEMFYDSEGKGEVASDFRLRLLLETLNQWDYDHDGVYDADDAVAAIARALPEASQGLLEFHRPQGTLLEKLCMAMLPDPPERHIILSYGNLKPRYKLKHYLLVIPMIALFAGLSIGQTELFPWMRYSPLLAVIDLYGVNMWLAATAAILSYLVLVKTFGVRYGIHSQHNYGLLSRLVVAEEQMFREGSETWTVRQRIMSCLAFGLIHQANLFYPLTSILPLAMSGAVFMWWYRRNFRTTRRRRASVLSASVLHRVFNRVVLMVIAVQLTAALAPSAYELLPGLAIATVVTWVAMAVESRRRRHRRR